VTAGSQHLEPRACLQQPPDEPGGSLDHMLAVIDDQEQTAISNVVFDNRDCIALCQLTYTKRGRKRIAYSTAFTMRGEIDEPNAVTEAIGHVASHLQS
jgi:hypothetical protein